MGKIAIQPPRAPVDQLLDVIHRTRSMLAPARRCGPLAVGKVNLALADLQHAMKNLQLAVRQIETHSTHSLATQSLGRCEKCGRDGTHFTAAECLRAAEAAELAEKAEASHVQ